MVRRVGVPKALSIRGLQRRGAPLERDNPRPSVLNPTNGSGRCSPRRRVGRPTARAVPRPASTTPPYTPSVFLEPICVDPREKTGNLLHTLFACGWSARIEGLSTTSLLKGLEIGFLPTAVGAAGQWSGKLRRWVCTHFRVLCCVTSQPVWRDITTCLFPLSPHHLQTWSESILLVPLEMGIVLHTRFGAVSRTERSFDLCGLQTCRGTAVWCLMHLPHLPYLPGETTCDHGGLPP